MIQTRLSRLDPVFWSSRHLLTLTLAWCLLGASTVAVSGGPWLLPVWLPVLGIILWRAARRSYLVTLSWTIPLGVLLAGAMALPGPAGKLGPAVLAIIGAAMVTIEPMQRSWVRLLARSRRVRVVDPPDHAIRLRAATSRVSQALADSSHDRDVERIGRAVAQARSEIDGISIPDGDPWSEPMRIASLWLRDLDAIVLEPNRDVAAYAAANRRARQLQIAEEVALNCIPDDRVP